MNLSNYTPPPTISTGIEGLDDILRGGLTAGRIYLIEGNPGSGKTTLALQYLMAGAAAGEAVMYITLSETREEIVAIAASHGWSLDNVHIFEMPIGDESLSPDTQLTMFHPSELELAEVTSAVLKEVDRIKPKRIVFDSLSEMRLLAQSPLRYRRQVLGLKHFFAGKHSTVLLIDDRTGPGEDGQLQSICHGVVKLDQLTTGYGVERRRLAVAKMRGVPFRGGYHDYLIRTGGLDVFPRLVAGEHHVEFTDEAMSSGNGQLDGLLAGGLPAGSSTLFIGPAGVGKSTVALQFAVEAARNGHRSALYLFDETIGTLRTRARKIGMPLDEYLKNGLITVQQVDPSELSPGEFATTVRRAAEGRDGNPLPAKMILIDSLNGYLHSMPNEGYLNAQLHELFIYLSQRGTSTMITVTQQGMVGAMSTPIDTTYLADNVILFRYFEARGRIRRAISIVKKRSGAHETTIRELRMNSSGIEIGEPLKHFEAILTGTPRFVGKDIDLMDDPASGEPTHA